MGQYLLFAIEDAWAWQKLSRIKSKDFQICITLQLIWLYVHLNGFLDTYRNPPVSKGVILQLKNLSHSSKVVFCLQQQIGSGNEGRKKAFIAVIAWCSCLFSSCSAMWIRGLVADGCQSGERKERQFSQLVGFSPWEQELDLSQSASLPFSI